MKRKSTRVWSNGFAVVKITHYPDGITEIDLSHESGLPRYGIQVNSEKELEELIEKIRR